MVLPRLGDLKLLERLHPSVDKGPPYALVWDKRFISSCNSARLSTAVSMYALHIRLHEGRESSTLSSRYFPRSFHVNVTDLNVCLVQICSSSIGH
ncbi:hypothetical protein Mapa_009367 [Marchantia paleacea]|nr:hypothetical protein Mapa_009367 [Marchantia paleacea]